MWWGAGDHLGWLKKPPAVPSAVSTKYSGTTASSLSYSWDTSGELNRERSFTAALTLTTGLSGGGVLGACLYFWSRFPTNAKVGGWDFDPDLEIIKPSISFLINLILINLLS
jgi:hypothetical protein